MSEKLLFSAIVVLVMAALITGLPSPDQYPLGERVLIETTPRLEEGNPSGYSQLLWLDDVGFDGVTSVNVRQADWSSGLKSVSIASEAWAIYVEDGKVSVSWRDSSITPTFVVTDEGITTDPIH